MFAVSFKEELVDRMNDIHFHLQEIIRCPFYKIVATEYVFIQEYSYLKFHIVNKFGKS